jgi:hypothetical protein
MFYSRIVVGGMAKEKPLSKTFPLGKQLGDVFRQDSGIGCDSLD